MPILAALQSTGPAAHSARPSAAHPPKFAPPRPASRHPSRAAQASVRGVEKAHYRFLKRIQRCPEQCVRCGQTAARARFMGL